MYHSLLCHVSRKWGRTITKMLLIMKVALIITLLAVTTVHARSFSQDITISGRNITLTAVFEAIHSQAGYSFVYEPKLLKKTSPVTLSVKGASVTDVLNLCLKGQGLSYEIKYNTIVIRDAQGNAIAEKDNTIAPMPPPRIIRGKVTDDNGQPMVGVTVAIKGSSKAVTTDGSGDFTISVPD